MIIFVFFYISGRFVIFSDLKLNCNKKKRRRRSRNNKKTQNCVFSTLPRNNDKLRLFVISGQKDEVTKRRKIVSFCLFFRAERRLIAGRNISHNFVVIDNNPMTYHHNNDKASLSILAGTNILTGYEAQGRTGERLEYKNVPFVMVISWPRTRKSVAHESKNRNNMLKWYLVNSFQLKFVPTSSYHFLSQFVPTSVNSYQLFKTFDILL